MRGSRPSEGLGIGPRGLEGLELGAARRPRPGWSAADGDREDGGRDRIGSATALRPPAQKWTDRKRSVCNWEKSVSGQRHRGIRRHRFCRGREQMRSLADLVIQASGHVSLDLLALFRRRANDGGGDLLIAPRRKALPEIHRAPALRNRWSPRGRGPQGIRCMPHSPRRAYEASREREGQGQPDHGADFQLEAAARLRKFRFRAGPGGVDAAPSTFPGPRKRLELDAPSRRKRWHRNACRPGSGWRARKASPTARRYPPVAAKAASSPWVMI